MLNAPLHLQYFRTSLHAKPHEHRYQLTRACIVWQERLLESSPPKSGRLACAGQGNQGEQPAW